MALSKVPGMRVLAPSTARSCSRCCSTRSAPTTDRSRSGIHAAPLGWSASTKWAPASSPAGFGPRRRIGLRARRRDGRSRREGCRPDRPAEGCPVEVYGGARAHCSTPPCSTPPRSCHCRHRGGRRGSGGIGSSIADALRTLRPDLPVEVLGLPTRFIPTARRTTSWLASDSTPTASPPRCAIGWRSLARR